jgi:hypothetical protein
MDFDVLEFRVPESNDCLASMDQDDSGRQMRGCQFLPLLFHSVVIVRLIITHGDRWTVALLRFTDSLT